MRGFIDVKSMGATGNGISNDSPYIQKAIDNSEVTGGIVWFPPGKYHLTTGLTVHKQVMMQGVGWSNIPGNGSWLYIDAENFIPITVEPGGAGTTIRDLAIEHKQPDPSGSMSWQPFNYPYAFEIHATDCLLHNIQLFNPTRGISIRNPGRTIGRVVLDRIWGQPLQEGITIDDAQDAIKIHNIHFWPFWNGNENHPVMDYVAGNAVAIQSFRNDNPHFSNIFVLGYKYGFHFGSGQVGITSKFRIANADCDFCGVGIQIDGEGTTGQITNWTTQGRQGAPVGLRIETNRVKVQATNVRVTNYEANGIRIDGYENMIFLENLLVEDWNMSTAGFPGVEVAAESAVIIGDGSRFEGGNGAPDVGGSGAIYRNIYWR